MASEISRSSSLYQLLETKFVSIEINSERESKEKEGWFVHGGYTYEIKIDTKAKAQGQHPAKYITLFKRTPVGRQITSESWSPSRLVSWSAKLSRTLHASYYFITGQDASPENIHNALKQIAEERFSGGLGFNNLPDKKEIDLYNSLRKEQAEKLYSYMKKVKINALCKFINEHKVDIEYIVRCGCDRDDYNKRYELDKYPEYSSIVRVLIHNGINPNLAYNAVYSIIDKLESSKPVANGQPPIEATANPPSANTGEPESSEPVANGQPPIVATANAPSDSTEKPDSSKPVTDGQIQSMPPNASADKEQLDSTIYLVHSQKTKFRIK